MKCSELNMISALDIVLQYIRPLAETDKYGAGVQSEIETICYKLRRDRDELIYQKLREEKTAR